MSLKIALDHPTLALKTKIQEISQNFLNQFGFNYFQYLRCFADGSIGLLTNETGLLEYYQHDNSPIIFSAFNNEHEHTSSYWFLWDDQLPELPVQIAKQKFNLHNGLTLVRRAKNYYDMIAVALPNSQPNPGSFYLNKLAAIEMYVREFDRVNKNLIEVMNQNLIALPLACRDINYKNICLTTGRLHVTGKLGATYITTQELACLKLFVQGVSYKQMAQQLKISSRTAETYLMRIRARTGFQSRAEFASMLLLCFAI